MRVIPRFAVAALVLLSACGGGDGGSTTPVKVVTRVTVNGATTTLLPGQTSQLTATAFEASGAQVTSSTFTWSTSSAAIASVDQSGRVTGNAAGTAIITADAAGVRGTLSVTVNAVATPVRDTINTLTVQFIPAFVTINLGQSVVFSFTVGSPHNAIFSKFNVPGSPPDIGNFSNQNFTRTFNARGKFPFECTLHAGMVGEITVQ